MYPNQSFTVGTIGAGNVAHRSDGRLVIFFAGDDTDAKATVSTFIDSLELAPVDLGELRQGGRLMQAGGPLIALHVVKIA